MAAVWCDGIYAHIFQWEAATVLVYMFLLKAVSAITQGKVCWMAAIAVATLARS